MENKRKSVSITTKFVLWFMLIALVPLVASTYLSYTSSRKAIRAEALKSLSAISDNKAARITSYFLDKIDGLVRFSGTPDIVDGVKALADAHRSESTDPQIYLSAVKEYRPFFSYYLRVFGYENILVIDPEGYIVYSDKSTHDPRSLYEVALYEESELARTFIEAKDNRSTEISDFEYDPEQGKVFFHIATPIIEDDNLIGVVASTISNRGLGDIAYDTNGMGDTGETIIAQKKEEEAVVLTRLRFDSGAAFKKAVPLDSQIEGDVRKAVQGEEGSGITVDHRGEDVLSVWTYLEDFNLGLAVKMDLVEAYSSANKLRNTLLVLGVVLVIMVSILAVVTARTISRPIKTLTWVSSVISAGDLTARADINTGDEIEELADAFNGMTDNLVKANREIEKEKDLLEKANQELDSFVYTVSHDLRAPLRGISSFASFLEEDYSDRIDDEGKGYLTEIKKGVGRMNEFIEDLLTLSRISRIKNPYEEVDIGALITSAVERIKTDLVEHNVDLIMQDDMPVVTCDRIKMAEVFLNLINNAVKFSSKNESSRPRVEVGYSDEEDLYRFFVKDNGIGIDPKDHDKVFGMFKRIQTEKKFEGTGAGLGIVKRVIDDHGGEIWVESRIGEGAKFLFTIPKGLKNSEEPGDNTVTAAEDNAGTEA